MDVTTTALVVFIFFFFAIVALVIGLLVWQPRGHRTTGPTGPFGPFGPTGAEVSMEVPLALNGGYTGITLVGSQFGVFGPTDAGVVATGSNFQSVASAKSVLLNHDGYLTNLRTFYSTTGTGISSNTVTSTLWVNTGPSSGVDGFTGTTLTTTGIAASTAPTTISSGPATSQVFVQSGSLVTMRVSTDLSGSGPSPNILLTNYHSTFDFVF